jgi:hypothetical protein
MQEGGNTHPERKIIDCSKVVRSEVAIAVKQQQRWRPSEVESTHRFRYGLGFTRHINRNRKGDSVFVEKRSKDFSLALGLVMLEYGM